MRSRVKDKKKRAERIGNSFKLSNAEVESFEVIPDRGPVGTEYKREEVQTKVQLNFSGFCVTGTVL